MNWFKRMWQQVVTWFRPYEGVEAAAASSPPPLPEPPPEQAREPKHHDFSFHHLRQDLAERSAEILDRFEQLQMRKADDSYVDSYYLKDIWHCDFLLMDSELGSRMQGGGKWQALEASADEMAEVIWPVEYAFAERRENHVKLIRVSTVTAQEVRGFLSIVRPRMLRMVAGEFGDHGKWSLGEMYFGLYDKTWRMLNASGEGVKWQRGWTDFVAQVLPSVLTARYQWHVAFGTLPDGPRLLFPTNPQHALKLFKDRNLAAGQNKRAALKHWVEEHWRDPNPEGDADLVYVCHHLRGQTQFNWKGFDCELFVSAFDLEKNAFFKQQAAEWRAQRKHNRGKVRLKKGTDRTMRRRSKSEP